MTRFASISVLALAITLSQNPAVTPALAASGAIRPPLVGQVAPGFRLVDQNGKAVTLSAVRGGKVVLVFYRGYW